MPLKNQNAGRKQFQFRYAVIALAVTALVGALGCIYGFVILSRGRQGSDWPSVKGVVVDSHVKRHAAGMPGHNAIVKYQYEVEQTKYSGTLRIHRLGQGLRWVEREYPAGKSVDVYYDPDDPAISVLEHGDTVGRYQFTGFCLFLFVAITAILLAVARKNRSRRGHVNRHAAADSTKLGERVMSSKVQRGKYAFLVLATPIVADCAIGVVLAFSGGLQSVHWYASVLWPLTIGLLVAGLWTGHRVNLPLTSFFCAISGFGLIVNNIPTNRLAPGSFFGHLAGWPPAVVILLGLWYLAAVLAFVLSPNIRAFFAHQRRELPPSTNALDSELNDK
ncbi:MAG: DUF3592 domain-containing protein [Planctomycetota bacterium]|nr:DUF3592 domain-containing protein [Planctomycetota bacterium]